jgi:hypothetical protein
MLKNAICIPQEMDSKQLIELTLIRTDKRLWSHAFPGTQLIVEAAHF